MKFILFFLAVAQFVIFPSSSKAFMFQRDSSNIVPDSIFVVDTISVIGNTHTESFVILREMTLQHGIIITHELLQYDQSRIYSLGLFNQVTIYVEPSAAGKANLVIVVSERWYIFPFPILGIKDRDWKKLYYGAGILHSNFRGRNEKLYAMFVFGYDPSGEIWYRNPFLSKDGSYTLDTKIAFSKVQNKSLVAQTSTGNFSEQHIYTTLGLGKRIGLHHTFWLSSGYEFVSVSEFKPGRTISTNGKDNFPLLGLSYTYDTRDLTEYSSSGSLINLSVTKFGFPSNKIDFIRYTTDLRRFQPVYSNIVLCGRMFTNNVAAGPTPSYNHVYFGYSERVRGHFKEVIEGENLFGFSTELHYQLFEPIYIKLKFLPQQFSILKFAMAAAVFGDVGTVWFRGQPFALNRFERGYGFGIHFLLPYSIVIRTECAFNENRRGEFVFDLGSSF